MFPTSPVSLTPLHSKYPTQKLSFTPQQDLHHPIVAEPPPPPRLRQQRITNFFKRISPSPLLPKTAPATAPTSTSTTQINTRRHLLSYSYSPYLY